LELLTSFGDGGRQPGQFYGVHSLAIDSQGSLYTTEGPRLSGAAGRACAEHFGLTGPVTPRMTAVLASADRCRNNRYRPRPRLGAYAVGAAIGGRHQRR
jgi:hypothetical protein